jgi:preprotein translocase subunit SecD
MNKVRPAIDFGSAANQLPFRPMWGARALAAVLIMVSAGCSSAEDGTPTPADPPSTTSTTPTAVTPAKPVEMRLVVDTTPEVRLKDSDTGEELALGPVEMKLERFKQAYVMPATSGPGHVIYLELPSDLADRFAELTLANQGKRLALVAGDKVIFAPQLNGAIIDGRIEVTGNYTQSEAEDLLTTITGK